MDFARLLGQQVQLPENGSTLSYSTFTICRKSPDYLYLSPSRLPLTTAEHQVAAHA